jgi:hypothetical protein
MNERTPAGAGTRRHNHDLTPPAQSASIKHPPEFREGYQQKVK